LGGGVDPASGSFLPGERRVHAAGQSRRRFPERKRDLAAALVEGLQPDQAAILEQEDHLAVLPLGRLVELGLDVAGEATDLASVRRHDLDLVFLADLAIAA